MIFPLSKQKYKANGRLCPFATTRMRKACFDISYFELTIVLYL